MGLRFALMYLLWLGALFGVLYWDLSPLSYDINNLLKDTLLDLLALGLGTDRVIGSDIWISPHYKLMIEKACNGMIPVLMYLGSIFAYPSNWSRRLKWAISGSVLILFVNLVRIYIVAYAVIAGGQESFSLSHDLFGNMFFVVVGVGLFYGFVHSDPVFGDRAL